MNVTRIIKKISLILLIIVLSLAFIAGVIWALDFTGVINFYKTAQKIPVVGKMIPVPKDAKVQKSPLQLENEKLRDEIEELKKQLAKKEKSISEKLGDLEHQLAVAKEKTVQLTADKKSLQETVDSLQQWKDEQQGQSLSYESLGRYYAEMKPDKAAKIMDNLADEVTIGILLNLEDEQVTAILSAMEPSKAAKIVDQMRQ